MTTNKAFVVLAALAAAWLAAGCASHTRMPSYEQSQLRLMISSETVATVHAVEGRGMGAEEQVQREVDRLLTLKPAARIPAHVVLYELPSAGPTEIKSSLKWLSLRQETSKAMKAALEQSGIFAQVDSLPEMLMPAGETPDLRSVRIAAARAQADGVLIYSTETGYDYRANGWALFYPTLIGLFAAPGSDLSSMAVSKAVLLDVHTGYIYAVLESYAQKSQCAPYAALDWEGLEYAVRRGVLEALAQEAAARAKSLAAPER